MRMPIASWNGSTRSHSNPSINSWQLSIGERMATSFTKKARLNAWLDAVQQWAINHGNELPIEPNKIFAAADQMAANGLRVLAFAQRKATTGQRELDHHHVARDLTFLGLQGMMDPPRPEAIAAVRRCQNAGIAVKMITGDHLLTARAIAQQIGLRGGSNARDAECNQWSRTGRSER